jgi:hypothetical protein
MLFLRGSPSLSHIQPGFLKSSSDVGRVVVFIIHAVDWLLPVCVGLAGVHSGV